MRIRVFHETNYTYEQPARGLIQVLRMRPRDHDGQYVRRWRIEPSVDGRVSEREDGFGNVVHWFTADEPAEALTIRVTGEVDTIEMHGIVRGTVERLPDVFYLRDSDLALANDGIQAFAREIAAAGDPAPLPCLHRLLAAVGERVAFEPAQAFAQEKGVCQDLTHLFIAAARHLEIPTRYVSGYFHHADGDTDQGSGHAWAEALVPGLGWVGFDAANGIATTEAHIRVAVALDYLGAAPIRGSRMGGGTETLDVTLRVEQAQATVQS
jgi:transglutaminase-like putative cysteine protease